MKDNRFQLGDLADPRKFHGPVLVKDYPLEDFQAALRTMFLIRKVEEIIGENVENGTIKCPCHLSIGQEAIPVGISKFLTPRDYVFGNHRSHGHYLALGGSVYQLLAEVLGKATGCSKGMGGSMHITARDVGFIGSVPIVSGTIPPAVGAALSTRIRQTDSVAVTYFGDGTTEEGTFHESLNMASNYKLPVLFVCENNLFSSHLYITERQPSDSLARFARANRIESSTIDGNDIQAVFQAAEKALKHLRNGEGPYFIEAVTYRWRGHVGPDENIDVGLRRKEDLGEWKKRDPIGRLVEGLKRGTNPETIKFQALEEEVEKEVRSEWERALQAPYPDIGQLLSTVYSR